MVKLLRKKYCKQLVFQKKLAFAILTEAELDKIREQIDGLKVEGDLRRETSLNIKRLMEIGSFGGIRHRRGLPVRGQNTKNNARTRKGAKRTVANKKK